MSALLHRPARVLVRSARRVYLLDPREITWVEAAGDYVTIHTPAKAHLVPDSMRGMESKLAKHGFCRIHRSSLVNVQCIRELIASDAGDYEVVLRDGATLRLSRNYRDALFTTLSASS